MKVDECKGCSSQFFEKRAICPKCKGTEFASASVESGIVELSTTIRVNRKGDLTPTNLVYARAGTNGLRVICRSAEELNRGDEIIFTESEGIVYCSRKVRSLEKSA